MSDSSFDSSSSSEDEMDPRKKLYFYSKFKLKFSGEFKLMRLLLLFITPWKSSYFI